MSVSSEGSIPPAEDNLNDSMGSSYSGHWLTDHVFDVDIADPNGNINQSVGQDGLFVDFNFPLSDSLLNNPSPSFVWFIWYHTLYTFIMICRLQWLL
ncbi:hypothetical protein NHX12_009020 [Muraenolepis orangiensis]|uniref:Uncharacterized protein n=1 Tax=Muraenolepis orangiensis TaxID=630683 RepID=A0A9Q0IAR9_9TELE|nr:hypothetical protein NHX12_009020 [Muraenolepis orangiensis]